MAAYNWVYLEPMYGFTSDPRNLVPFFVTIAAMLIVKLSVTKRHPIENCFQSFRNRSGSRHSATCAAAAASKEWSATRRVEFPLSRQHSDARRNLLMNLQVRTFRTRQQAIEHLKRMQATFIRPEKVYDPEDPNADSNGHVWVISLSADGSADRLYLCSDGYIR